MNLFHIDKEFERKVQSITENICNFISRHKRILTVAILLSTFIVLFGNIYFSEYISDDLIYMNKWQSSEPISNLYDIFEYQINHYFLWGGRSIAHTILQLLFLIGKPVSAILTTLVFMICAYLINIYSCEKFNIITYSGIVGLLYFLNPIYSETIRWYTGSANYLWTITIVLVAIYPFVNVIKGKIPCQNNIYIYI